MRIRRLPRAIRDVDDIWFHIATDDPAAATRLVERLARGVARLADFPESGRARPEIGPGARSVGVGRYLVLYRLNGDCVDIVRVIHGAREISGLLDGRHGHGFKRPRRGGRIVTQCLLCAGW